MKSSYLHVYKTDLYCTSNANVIFLTISCPSSFFATWWQLTEEQSSGKLINFSPLLCLPAWPCWPVGAPRKRKTLLTALQAQQGKVTNPLHSSLVVLEINWICSIRLIGIPKFMHCNLPKICIALLKISRFPHPDYPREAGKPKKNFPRQKPAGLRSLLMICVCTFSLHSLLCTKKKSSLSN